MEKLFWKGQHFCVSPQAKAKCAATSGDTEGSSRVVSWLNLTWLVLTVVWSSVRVLIGHRGHLRISQLSFPDFRSEHNSTWHQSETHLSFPLKWKSTPEIENPIVCIIQSFQDCQRFKYFAIMGQTNNSWTTSQAFFCTLSFYPGTHVLQSRTRLQNQSRCCVFSAGPRFSDNHSAF